MIQFSESHALVAAALIAVQREVQPVVKDRTNPLLKNKYATLDAITDYVRPLLAKNDLALAQSVSPSADHCISVETLLVHVSGEWVRNAVLIPMGDGNKGTSLQQAAGSTITYGRRYGLSALLALTTDEDDDGNGRGQTSQRRESRRAPRVAQAANAAGAVRVADIPFPAVLGFERLRGTPLKDVPTEALETCYQRTKDRTEKKAQMVAKAIEEVLEDRRTAADFGELHPSLRAQEGTVHA